MVKTAALPKVVSLPFGRGAASAVVQPDIGAGIDPAAILASLRNAIIVIDAADRLVSVNGAAEQLFDGSASVLTSMRLGDFLPADHPIFGLVSQVREHGYDIAEYAVAIDTPRLGRHSMSLQLGPLPERPGHVVLTFHERSMAEKLDRQLVSRNAARSVTAMAAILAHEVKNPLSGIRGAAQLLEQNAEEGDRLLTNLICEETDRICALVNRMEMFSDGRPLSRAPVNIHQVLERVRRSAQSGFGKHVRFVEDYDPSLPPVDGNRDMLVQVLMNLVKNAAEAVPDEGGEITLSTAYSPGVRVATAPGKDRATPSAPCRLRAGQRSRHSRRPARFAVRPLHHHEM